MRVIWTTFAKHHDTLPLHLAYVNKLVELGHVHEVHVWLCHEVHVWHALCHEESAINAECQCLSLFPYSNKREYYAHYTPDAYSNHIIIQAIDDIVYIDIDRFPEFISHRMALPHPLLYANIVNHGSCIMHQSARGLINLGIAKHEALYGKLWESGDLAERLHSTFIENVDEWRTRVKTQPVRVHKSRFGLHFFAIMSKDLRIFSKNNMVDDEAELTYFTPLETGQHNAIDLSFLVSHLSFSQQIFDKAAILEKYKGLGVKCIQ